MRRNPISTNSIIAIAVFLAAMFFSATAAQEQVRPAVVLGHYPAGVATPTPPQIARCLKALELYRDGKTNRIVVTGGYTRGHISEARMMKIALVAYGIPEEHIVEEDMASTTVENGVFSAPLFDALGWKKRTVLISQPGHLWRAKVNFQDQGFDIKNVNAKEIPEKDDYDLLPKEEEQPTSEEILPLVVVFEPFDSKEPMNYPGEGTARRLRAAAQLYREGKTKKILVAADWYTRSPVDIPEMMQVALVALGVPEEDIILKSRVHYSNFSQLTGHIPERPALIITASNLKTAVIKDKEGLILWSLD
ncbi:ElyC/SanA/YdcF family protein [bacterium]